MRSLSAIIRNPLCIFAGIVRKYCYKYLSDRAYLRFLYFFEQGTLLHLNNPKKFTEKIQWLKLNDRKLEYVRMVDKISAKDFAREKIGPKYLIPTIGVWNDFDSIDFESLPNAFVLKSTNGSGGAVYICRDKNNLNIDNVRIQLEGVFKGNVGLTYREWPYLKIRPRYIAEEFMSDSSNTDLIDYKFFCFNGAPKYCQVICNRRSNETIDFYDMDWNHQEFFGLNPTAKSSRMILPRPENFEEMIKISEKLASGIPFLRVDLYNINGKIFFGETTFYPASGFGRFTPKKWDEKLGDMLILPQI